MRIVIRICCACLLYFLAMGNSVAQIPPPDLNCVFNEAEGTDTIRWDLPMVSCGTIQGIEVYQSTSPNGPFTLVATVTNIANTELAINNTSNEIFYYYLQIDADCPGESPTPSDTLSNQIPPGVQIVRVSVENGNVLVQWNNESGNVPKIAGYIIYRVGVGTIPIDTVYGAVDSIIDTDGNPGLQSELYYVQAIDGCGKSGPIGNNPHHTIYLQDSLSPCARALYFEWNDYDTWSTGVEYFELFVSIDGAPFNSVNTIPAGTFTAELPDLNARNNYRIYIRAKKMGEAVYSRSNVIDISPNISQGVVTLHLWGVDVENTGLFFNWNWNTDAEFAGAELIQSPGGIAISTDLNNFIITPQAINDFQLDTDLGQNGSVEYAIRTLDECDSVKWSDTVRTAYLSTLALDGFTNRVNISYPHVGKNVKITGCEVLRLKEGVIDDQVSLSDSTTSLEDEFDASDETNRKLCYQLRCQAETTLQDSSIQNFTLHSNISCPVQRVRMQIPNAFRPEGTNNFFRPLFLFENSIQEYSLQIYDRWGQLIFESNDPQIGWEGLRGDDPMTKGVYVYRIHILQDDGEQIERKGTVMLVR